MSNPSDQVRYDVGGWISGPCLDQPLNQPPDMTPAEATSLWTLRNTWGTYYGISFVSDVWRAYRLGAVTRQITADTSEELSGLIWADFTHWKGRETSET